LVVELLQQKGLGCCQDQPPALNHLMIKEGEKLFLCFGHITWTVTLRIPRMKGGKYYH
jgi:hypothetical protein